MIDINIQEVGMENFGPYTTPMVLNFNKDEITLVTGPNGCGKTTALDAIPFTFYNATTKGAKGDDLVNNTTGKNCKTWVKFSINDTDNYIVTRYQKYTNLGTTVVLNKNGDDIKKGQREVLPVIEKLICSKRAFMNTLMFGQKVKDFFTDLVDSDKKLIFRELLSLEQYEKYHKTTADLIKDVNNEEQKINQQIAVDKGILKDTNDQIEEIKQQRKNFDEKKKAAIKEAKKQIDSNTRLYNEWVNKHDNLATEIDSTDLEDNLKELSINLTKLENKKNNDILKIKQLKENKISEVKLKATESKSEIFGKNQGEKEEKQNQVQKYQQKENKINGLIKDLEHQKDLDISQINNELRFNKKEIEEIQSNVLNQDISTCPTCKQTIDEDIIEELKQKIQTLVDKNESLKKQINTINNDFSKEYHIKYKQATVIKEIIEELTNDLKAVQQKIINETSAIDIKVKEAIEKLNDLEIEKIKHCKEQYNNDSNVLLLEIKETQSKIQNQKDLQEEIQKIDKIIFNLDKEIQLKEFEVKRLEEQEYDSEQLFKLEHKKIKLEKSIYINIQLLDGLTSKINLLNFWKSAFSSTGIPSMLIDEAIPFLNDRVFYYLDKFTNGRYLVSFDTIAETKSGEYRDKISVNVIDTYTKANNRVQLSGGQTRIIDIATILTLGDLQSNIQGMKINILLFDEIFDSLDEENIGYVSKVLNTIKEDKSIYLISHRHVDQLEADQVLNFQS